MNETANRSKKWNWYVRIVCVALFIIIGAAGLWQKSYNVIYGGIFCLFLHNIFLAFENIRTRIYFFIMHFTFFVFYMTSPLISIMRGKVWWEYRDGPDFALTAMTISLIFMAIGAWAAEKIAGKKREWFLPKKEEKRKLFTHEFYKKLQTAALLVFCVSWAFYLGQQLEKLFFLHDKTYLDYYTQFQSTMPLIVTVIASFMKYSLCIFLATFPSKKKAFVPLGMFLVSAVPELLIGLRNPIVLNALFIFLYYFVRDVLEDREKWIGRFERIALIIMCPASILGLSAITYLRSARSVTQKSVFELFVNFFNGQGVSFRVLCEGHWAIPQLPDHPFRNYTFGGILDYFQHGTIAQKLFGAKALPSGNNLINATEGNSLAHHISYITKGDKYLKGRGWGSSYLLETYVDFGYVGVAVFSLILGLLLVLAIYMWRKTNFCRIVILLSSMTIFFIPRAEATGWMMFLLTLQFWLCMIGCYGLAWLWMKFNGMRKNEK